MYLFKMRIQNIKHRCVLGLLETGVILPIQRKSIFLVIKPESIFMSPKRPYIAQV